MKIIRSRLMVLLIIALLLTALLPLGLIGFVVIQSFQQRNQATVAAAVNPLRENGLDALETRASDTAALLAAFLRERESDLRALASAPQSVDTLMVFGDSHRREVWTIDPDTGAESRLMLPLYREIAVIDTQGQEQVKIENVCFYYPWDCRLQVAVNLRDVSNPLNTTYRSETYFSEVQTLQRDAIWVGRPIGYYIPAAESYRSLPEQDGQRFQGVMRFLMPIYEGDTRTGYLMLALDHTHVMEFVAHLDPTATRPLPLVGAETDSFAYLVGMDGGLLAHPFHNYIVGVDRGGAVVPPFSENLNSGPANLTQMGFLSDAFPTLISRLTSQPSGHIERFSVGGTERTLTYAVIDYRAPQHYPDGFGAVVLYLPDSELSVETTALVADLQAQLGEVMQRFMLLFSVTGVIAVIVALLFGRGVIAPIRGVTDAAATMEERDLTDTEIRTLADKPGHSEVSRLARAFGHMALNVRERENQIAQLLLRTDEALAQRVQELQVLGEIGRKLTSSLDLGVILQSAVDALQRQTGARCVRLEIKTEGGTQTVSAGDAPTGNMSPSMIAIELDDRTIGRFLLYTAEPLDAEQRSFGEQLAAWVGVAVKNAQLYEVSQTQKHQLEITNAEVVKANRLKSEFLATMSHELRTPLNVIIGYCDLLLEGLAGEVDAEARRMLTRVHSNAQKLLALINDVLDLSRIEAGRMQLQLEGVELDDLIDRWRADMQLLADQKGLKFEIKTDAALPDSILTDTARLTQIVTNLITNAFKFTEKGGVYLSLKAYEDAWSISVRDTGIGIPEDALPYIFEEFRQVDASPTRAHGGTGLGLAIVRNFTKLMGGEVQVESKLGVGSTFTVTLPIRTPIEAAM
jgi:signal transduction histidine kinase